MDVIKLQKKLEILGYAEFDEYTDLFNTKTRESVIEFQVDQKLVADESSLGAGHFGPKTRAKFNELYIGI
jgi:peptidoglycan hydrolase-like protein with peptidoglycan-binding domain